MIAAPQLTQISDSAIMVAATLYCLAMLCHIAEWALSRTPAPQFTRQPVSIATGLEAGEPAETKGLPRPSLSDEVLSANRHSDRVELAGRAGVGLTLVAAGLHVMGVLTRGLAVDRVPWGNMYEFTITGAAAATLTYLAWLRFQPVRWLGLPTTALAVIMLMLAVLVLDVPAGPLVPALQSYWLVIHVSAALIATGAFTIGAVASALYLIRRRTDAKRQRQRRSGDEAPEIGVSGRETTERGATGSRWGSLLPSAEAIDRIAYQLHAFAFPVWTFAALVAGPIWAKYAWGRYWGWDPKEVWAFITWGVYAAYLHARATAGWRGTRASVLALVGFATLWFNFIGVNFFIAGLHSYAGK